MCVEFDRFRSELEPNSAPIQLRFGTMTLTTTIPTTMTTMTTPTTTMMAMTTTKTMMTTMTTAIRDDADLGRAGGAAAASSSGCSSRGAGIAGCCRSWWACHGHRSPSLCPTPLPPAALGPKWLQMWQRRACVLRQESSSSSSSFLSSYGQFVMECWTVKRGQTRSQTDQTNINISCLVKVVSWTSRTESEYV